MAGVTGTCTVMITGHNRESPSRVVHYLRQDGPVTGPVEFQGGVYVTDEKGILADGTKLSLTISGSVVTGKVGSGG